MVTWCLTKTVEIQLAVHCGMDIALAIDLKQLQIHDKIKFLQLYS